MENNSLNNKGVIVGPTTAGKGNKISYNPNNKLWLYLLIAVIIIVAMLFGVINKWNVGDVIKTVFTTK